MMQSKKKNTGKNSLHAQTTTKKDCLSPKKFYSPPPKNNGPDPLSPYN